MSFITGASLAQSVEQLIRNEQVIGSSPMTGSIFSSSSSILCFPFSSCAFPKNQLVGENCLRGDFLSTNSGIQSGGHGGGDSGIILGYRRMRRNTVAGDLGSFRTHQGEIVRNSFPVQREGVGGDSSGILPAAAEQGIDAVAQKFSDLLDVIFRTGNADEFLSGGESPFFQSKTDPLPADFHIAGAFNAVDQGADPSKAAFGKFFF